MSSRERNGLYSPLSITKELWPWCISVICVLTAAWTALIAWNEVSGGNHPNIIETSIAVGTKAAAGVPLIFIYSVIIVSVVSFIKGGGLMVMARAVEEYLNDKLKSQRERWREQRERRREQWHAEGREQGREEMAAKIAGWNQRRLDAEERGEPFDEPPPGI